MLNPRPGDLCLQAGSNPALVLSVDDFDAHVNEEARERIMLFGEVFKRPRWSPSQRPRVTSRLGVRVPVRWLSPVAILPEPHGIQLHSRR